jgi:phosphoribosylformylglycinamidine cyclo-ligase
VSLDYRSSGVDQDRKDRAIEDALSTIEKTYRPGVIPNPGGFAGLFSLGRFTNPVLVSSTDGVGTKLKLAGFLGKHDTVGIDLVAMSVNDLLVQGAEPLFFLDYIAMGRVVPERVKAIIEGVAEGCRQSGCALLGGETAEMPGMYEGEDYDLAGFAVGVVERDRLVTGAKIAAGDILLGVRSSGVHSNGYSLVRKVFLDPARGGGARLHERPASLGGRTLGEALLEPTRIYAGAVKALVSRFIPQEDVKGFAHITGAGIPGNLPRIFPPGIGARIWKGAWQIPPLFDIIREAGSIEQSEMYRVFNMGIGLIVAVRPQLAREALDELGRAGYEADPIGVTVEGPSDVELEDGAPPAEMRRS